MSNNPTTRRPMSEAPRDGRWITLHRQDGRSIRAAWMVPVWSICRDPTKPDWISDQFKFADPFSAAIGWTP